MTERAVCSVPLQELLDRIGLDFLACEHPFLLAVSGGVDSMLLLHLFGSLHREGRLRGVPVVYHLDHALRPESPLDAELVRSVSMEYSLPYFGLRRDCATAARRTGRGIEETGRRLRYRHLGRILHRSGGGIAVTAHHADDYAESLLLHLIRGGGTASFSTLDRLSAVEGIPVFRPFVLLDRSMILRFAEELGVHYREDPSNRSPEYARNRIRNGILPLLVKEGMNSVNLWMNFHEIIDISSTGASGSPPPARVLLDRELFSGGHSVIKRSLDAALRRLGLSPVPRGVIEEILRQRSANNGRFRLRMKECLVHSQEGGDVWIVPYGSPLLRPCEVLEGGSGGDRVRISYGGVIRDYPIEHGHVVCERGTGMRFRIRGGVKTLKKIMQESRLPPEVRDRIPLIVDPSSGLVVRICFSFLDGMRDLTGYGERNGV